MTYQRPQDLARAYQQYPQGHVCIWDGSQNKWVYRDGSAHFENSVRNLVRNGGLKPVPEWDDIKDWTRDIPHRVIAHDDMGKAGLDICTYFLVEHDHWMYSDKEDLKDVIAIAQRLKNRGNHVHAIYKPIASDIPARHRKILELVWKPVEELPDVSEIDWHQYGMGKIPPARVKPVERNAFGNTVKDFEGNGYDAFCIREDGNVYWRYADSDDCAPAIKALYTLDGRLLGWANGSKWLKYEDIKNKEMEETPRVLLPIPSADPSPTITTITLTKKPFDPVAMCREKERLRHMFDTRTPVNIQWLKPGDKRY